MPVDDIFLINGFIGRKKTRMVNTVCLNLTVNRNIALTTAPARKNLLNSILYAYIGKYVRREKR